MFENARRGRQARNFTTNAPKILDLKSSSEQIFSRKLPLGAPDKRGFLSRHAVQRCDSSKGNPKAILANRKIRCIYAVLANKIIRCIYLCSCVFMGRFGRDLNPIRDG